MKSFFLTALSVLFLSISGYSQDAISKYFSSEMDNPDFTTVMISPSMFKMIGDLEIDDFDPELQELITNLKGLRVLTTEKNTLSNYKKALSKIQGDNYETFMEIREKDEKVHFFVDKSGDTISELVLLVGGADEFVAMSIAGDITMSQLSKLANMIDLKGTDHLKKLEDAD